MDPQLVKCTWYVETIVTQLIRADFDIMKKAGIKNEATDELPGFDSSRKYWTSIDEYFSIEVFDLFAYVGDAVQGSPCTTRYILDHKKPEPSTIRPEIKAILQKRL